MVEDRRQRRSDRRAGAPAAGSLGENSQLMGGAPSALWPTTDTAASAPMATSAPEKSLTGLSGRRPRHQVSTKFITIILLVLSLIGFNLYITSQPTLTRDAGPSGCMRVSHPQARKPKVVLVHGFNSGAWYWFRVVNRLKVAGYDVTALDLKASGMDHTHIEDVETFEDYNAPLDQFMSRLQEHERVVVVGHSAGGVSVTKTVLDHSEKVLAAIYVAATMLKSGYLTCHDLRIGVPNFSRSRCSSSCPQLPKATCFEKALLGAQETPLVYEEEYTTLRTMMARAGPYRAIVTTDFTKSVEESLGVDRVARVYVKTRFDETLLPEQQDEMIRLWPPCEVVASDNDHDVPVANPDLLVSVIINATMYV